jgi:hypothetical protein
MPRPAAAGAHHYRRHHSSFTILMSRPFRVLHAAAFVLATSAAALGMTACDDSPTAPSEGAVVTFRVVNETFRVHLTSDEQIRGAELALGNGPAKIPNGRIVTGADVNQGYSWHLIDLTFAEATIELCDGKPSDVERAGVSFGGGRFCPWSAQVLSIDYAK